MWSWGDKLREGEFLREMTGRIILMWEKRIECDSESRKTKEKIRKGNRKSSDFLVEWTFARSWAEVKEPRRMAGLVISCHHPSSSSSSLSSFFFLIILAFPQVHLLLISNTMIWVPVARTTPQIPKRKQQLLSLQFSRSMYHVKEKGRKIKKREDEKQEYCDTKKQTAVDYIKRKKTFAAVSHLECTLPKHSPPLSLHRVHSLCVTKHFSQLSSKRGGKEERGRRWKEEMRRKEMLESRMKLFFSSCVSRFFFTVASQTSFIQYYLIILAVHIQQYSFEGSSIYSDERRTSFEDGKDADNSLLAHFCLIKPYSKFYSFTYFTYWMNSLILRIRFPVTHVWTIFTLLILTD